MRPILRALRLFSRERGLWKFAVQPLLWGALAFLVVLIIGTALGAKVGTTIGGLIGAGSQSGGGLGALLGFLVTIALGSSIYLALVGFISGFGFDRLSQEVEQRAFGHVVGKSPSFSEGLSDTIGRVVLAAFIGLIALCGSGTVIVPWLAAAFLSLMDFTAPALIRRGVGLGRQFAVARRRPGATGFAAICGILILIPVVNVLALPILVTAGTILVADESA